MDKSPQLDVACWACHDPSVELLRRSWASEPPPISFPDWRRWEDRRVRADNNVMALFAAVRIAKASIQARIRGNESSLVSELYSEEELCYRGAFALGVNEAERRLSGGTEDLARMSIVISVAATDDLFGGFIRLLRATGHDSSAPGSVSTGVNEKHGHLRTYSGLQLSSQNLALYRLLVEIRHAVTHHGATQQSVIKAWDRLGTETQRWWREAGGRPLPLTNADDELRVDDRDLLASLKALDRIVLEVANAARETVPIECWADLVVAEYRLVNLKKANDPSGNISRIVKHASSVWRIAISAEDADLALKRECPPSLKLLGAIG